MRWTLTEDQELFQDAFRGWLERFAAAEDVRGWLDSGDSAPFERRFVEEGWFSVGSPESLGGQGGGLLDLALAAEQLGRAAAPSSAWLASVLAAPVLPAETAEACLTEGEFVALAVSAGKPVDAATTVVAEGGTLRGTVPLVLAADRARRFVVPAGGRLYLVDAEEASLTRRALLDRSRSVADVVLDGAHGTELSLPVAELSRIALRAAVLVAADSLGAAERMLELAVEYSKQRKQFGVPIGSFQAVKHAAATMLVTVESARSLVYYAAAAVEQEHEDYVLHAAAAKAQVCAEAVRAADSALTMHGAIGYTWEHDLQLFYKRAKLNGSLFGAPAVWNERLARELPLLPAA
ncbi:MAG TPA: acyl-CoA dehydrogenase family protein [Amycolatopsis sp.]|uniref:acyl-CoA dehydrogenase family protein n=1 Tax=unclassified Amycolatopsis TaxID=2618356 RepID=UPI00106E2F4B|nr:MULTISPECIES: acyl-CoA dehydrogenase family protein [unclassified Amycolatopsis]HWD05749.1 acyl-CoA dehydrogenase family protein [Amycolatopsis sp.]